MPSFSKRAQPLRRPQRLPRRPALRPRLSTPIESTRASTRPVWLGPPVPVTTGKTFCQTSPVPLPEGGLVGAIGSSDLQEVSLDGESPRREVSLYGSLILSYRTYDWDSAPVPGTPLERIEFVPMAWGTGSVDSFAANSANFRAWGVNSLLSFNEPDVSCLCVSLDH